MRIDTLWTRLMDFGDKPVGHVDGEYYIKGNQENLKCWLK